MAPNIAFLNFFEIDLVDGRREPQPFPGLADRKAAPLAVRLQQRLGAFAVGLRQEVPLIAILARQLEVVDQQRVVGLRAQPGHGPVLAAGPHPARSVAVLDHQELVVTERTRRDHAVVQIDLALEPLARRLVLILALLLDAAVGEHHMRALAELLQGRLSPSSSSSYSAA